MQQRTRRLAIFLGGTLIATAGVLAACSTDNGTTPLPGQTGNDAGRDTSRADGNNGNEDDDSSGNTTKDAAPDCEGAPTPRSNKGIFCFGGTDSNDAGQCDPAENKVCCADEKGPDGKFLKSKCAVATEDQSGGYQAGSCNFGADAGGREWHCTESKHCPNQGESCCVVAGTGGPPKAQPDTRDFPGCGNFFNNDQGFFVGGSRCRADGCNAGELTLCSSDAECSGGQTCRFFELANRFTGVCQ